MTGRRRGQTLAELMVALVLTGLVGTALIRCLLIIRRAADAQVESAGMETALRSAALLGGAELRELGGDSLAPDILQFAAESLTYRATRGSGVACRITPTAVVLDGTLQAGYRQPQAGRDSLQLFVEGDPLSRRDDAWLRLPILSVATDSCRGGPALALGTVVDSALVASDAIDSLAPVRLYEIMQLKLYTSAGVRWLGARSVSAGESIQPLLGPLASAGFSLTGLDSTGSPETRPASIRSLRIMLRGVPAHATHWGGMAPALLRGDSLELVLTLRNTGS